ARGGDPRPLVAAADPRRRRGDPRLARGALRGARDRGPARLGNDGDVAERDDDAARTGDAAGSDRAARRAADLRRRGPRAAVGRAAVVARPDPEWDEGPVAFVVARAGAAPTPEALADFLRPHVARWWLPDAFELVDELPKTSVGKVDKRRLRALAAGAEALS